MTHGTFARTCALLAALPVFSAVFHASIPAAAESESNAEPLFSLESSINNMDEIGSGYSASAESGLDGYLFEGDGWLSTGFETGFDRPLSVLFAAKADESYETGFGLILARDEKPSAGHLEVYLDQGKLAVYAPNVLGGAPIVSDISYLDYKLHFGAVTWDGNSVDFYDNGALIGSYRTERLPGAPGNSILTVGAGNSSEFPFAGFIGKLELYDGKLTSEQIAAKYTELTGKDPSAAPEPTRQPEPTNTPEPREPAERELYYWPLDGRTTDLTGHKFDIDTMNFGEGFRNGVAGQCAEVEFHGLFSDEVPYDIDLTDFSFAFWVKWEDSAHEMFAVPFAVADKQRSCHVEIYLRYSGDEGKVCVLNGPGNALESAAAIKRGEFAHIAAVNSAEGFTLYVNGEAVLQSSRLTTVSLGNGTDIIALGSLTDGTITCAGLYDEVLLANYAMTAGEIAGLYGDPAGSRAKLYAECGADPDATEKPTVKPTQSPSPTGKAVSTGGGSGQITKEPARTLAPDDEEDGGGSMLWLIPAGAAAAAVIAAAVILTVKKRGKKAA